MSLKLRQSVPKWVLLVIVTFMTTKLSSHSELQSTESFVQTLKQDFFLQAGKILELSADQCTVPELFCDIEVRMTYLSVEKKQTISLLYTFGKKNTSTWKDIFISLPNV